MRFIHTSDWHLGRTLHGESLAVAQQAFADHLVGLVKESGAAAVLVAGDVYDRAVPPPEAVALLSETLRRLTELAHVVVISGNHDSAVRLGFGAALMRPELHVCTDMRRAGRPVVIPDPAGGPGLAVYPIPYLDPDVARVRLAPGGPGGGEDDAVAPEPLARSHRAVLGEAIRRVRADIQRSGFGGPGAPPAVALAHAFVTGGRASDSERDIRVGGVDQAPSGLFGGVGYAALGHLHGPQAVPYVAAQEEACRDSWQSDPGLSSLVAVTGVSEQPSGSTSSRQTAKTLDNGPGLGMEDPDAEVGSGADPVLRYAGSPLAFSFSEEHQAKSTAVVDIDQGGRVGVELAPAPVPRPLTTVRGALDDLLGPAFEDVADHWVRAIVTDPVRPREMVQRLKARFPHALVMLHEPAGTAGAEAPRAGRVQAERDPLEVGAEFVEYVTGAPPSDQEAVQLRAALESVLAGAAGREN
ncbi:MAG: exonuclease SbcCD subunit D [Bifidobacteriaceae bacterium]|jgi:exonuclease SbcD|nr:exonuclease SbcCD subunit D [Bifidobacteriaceae bacterium]